MKRRRKCLYPNCGHCQGDKLRKCKLRVFPKDPIAARRWLNLAGISNVSPKKILSTHRICSCHFDGDVADPIEFIEEYVEVNTEAVNVSRRLFTNCERTDFSSPPSKVQRVREESLSPATKEVLETLMSLGVVPENSVDSASPRGKATFSPRRNYWSIRAKISRRDSRKRLHNMIDNTDVPDDLGVAFLPDVINSDGICNEHLHPSTCDLNSNADLEVQTVTDAKECDDICKELDKSPASDLHNNYTFEVPQKCAARSLIFDNDEDGVKLMDLNACSEDSGEVTDQGPLQKSQCVSSTPLPTVSDCSSSLNLPEDSDRPHHPSSRSVTTSRQNITCELCGCSFKEMPKRSVGIQCNRSFLCYEKCKKLPEEEFQFYTSVTQDIFEMLYNFLGGDEVCTKLKYEYTSKTPKREQCLGELTPKDKLFLTLLRIRKGITLKDLKILFNIHEGHASRICFTWIRFMSLEFRKLEQVMFLSTEAQNGRRSKCFKDFDNLRIIIDTTEFRIQKPSNQKQSSNSFSEYKSYHTEKFLIGISCFGGLSFISEGYEGSISDRKLIEESGFMDHLQPHDGVMSDKGFDMEDKCDERNVDLYIPSFLGRRNAFTGRELIYSRAISAARIFVEIFIGKIKEFRLVRNIIPNSMLPVSTDLVRVCAFLVNFQKPFVRMSDEDKVSLID